MNIQLPMRDYGNNWKILLKHSKLIFILILFPLFVNGQFAYLGGGIKYGKTTFKRTGYSTTSTKNISINYSIDGMYRPFRFLAVGFEYSSPIFQKSNFTFDTEDYSGFNDFNDPYGNEIRFVPNEYNYEFNWTSGTSIFARLFSGALYLDFKLEFATLEESFVLQRDYLPALFGVESYNLGDLVCGSVMALDINEFIEHKVTIPGIGFGLMQNVSKHIYYDIRFGFDFINFGDPGFLYIVDYDYDEYQEDYDRIEMESAVTGSKLKFSTSFSLGYIF